MEAITIFKGDTSRTFKRRVSCLVTAYTSSKSYRPSRVFGRVRWMARITDAIVLLSFLQILLE